MKQCFELMIGEAALSAVLPESYSHYRLPIKGALGLFIESLNPAHRADIFQRQALLPLSAPPAQRLALLARSCPALHKLGQSLARERRLPAEFRRHLQQLESIAPEWDIELLRRELTRELGPLERLGVTLLSPALAEASVAIVVPFQWNRNGDDILQGVFKMLKPGIAERLAYELDLLGKVGAYLDERCAEFGIPRIDYQGTFEQVRDKLQHEVRLDQEQRHLAMAAEFYAGDDRVQIPKLFPFCTPRVTAMERIWGNKVTDHALEGYGQARLAERVIRSLIARPVLSRAPKAFFHADPHAGNLFLTDQGRLAILDWSLVGWLGERECTAMVQLLLAAVSLDPQRITRILLDLNVSRNCNPPALKSVVDTWLKQIRQLRLPGFNWLTGMLDEAVQQAGLGLAADLMLFRKTLHSLEGVIADIGAPPNAADQVLMREFLLQFAREWPLRWIKPLFSRSYATRLSSADLIAFLAALPLTLGRYLLPAETGRSNHPAR
jgi:ubiquinone biosynthesis protein